jgi:hypothetical protein
VQIEGVVNSRPLHPLSSEPDELTCLTPAHFLINDSLASVPEADLAETSINRLSLWNQIQKMRQLFWKRWSTAYLNSLQQRVKFGCAIVPETSCRAEKFTSRTLM